jgi:hypothetical protein
VLPFLLLQAVRCEHCHHRGYVLRTIPVLERDQADRKQSQSQPSNESKSESRVA